MAHCASTMVVSGRSGHAQAQAAASSFSLPASRFTRRTHATHSRTHTPVPRAGVGWLVGSVGWLVGWRAGWIVVVVLWSSSVVEVVWVSDLNAVSSVDNHEPHQTHSPPTRTPSWLRALRRTGANAWISDQRSAISDQRSTTLSIAPKGTLRIGITRRGVGRVYPRRPLRRSPTPAGTSPQPQPLPLPPAPP